MGNRNYLSYCEQGLEEWGSEPNRFNGRAEVIAFNPNIDEAFQTQRGFFCDVESVAGMVVLLKLGKVLVHSGNVTLNIRFFKVGKR